MLELLDTYIGGFRFASIVEIAIVAAFFFLVFTWVRQSITRQASRNVLVAIFLYVTAYLLAGLFDLYFVELVIENSFVLFAVALVVTFQREIRRIIDFIGTWRPFHREPSTGPDGSVTRILTEAAFSLAERHVGALIAVRGRESLDGHIEGGVELDGRTSFPLLYSIFDPDSPGHDGAVLIEGDRLTHFGVHLPLPTRLPEASRFGGTRHAAAQGLSEVTDAFVIVVSEERGVVSVAEGGNLVVIESPDELRERLDAFWSLHYDMSSVQRKARTSQHLKTGAVAAALAFLLWASFTAYEPGTVFRTYFVRVELAGVPDSLWISSPNPAVAQVTLSGSGGAFRVLNEAALLITVNLEDVATGTNEVQITEDNIEVPGNLSVYDIEPEIIRVEAQPFVQSVMQIQMHTTGALPDSLVLTGLRASPDSITVLIPASDATERPTLPLAVDLSRIHGTTEFIHRLNLPARWQLPPDESQEITVTVDVARKTLTP